MHRHVADRIATCARSADDVAWRPVYTRRSSSRSFAHGLIEVERVDAREAVENEADLKRAVAWQVAAELVVVRVEVRVELRLVAKF